MALSTARRVGVPDNVPGANVAEFYATSGGMGAHVAGGLNLPAGDPFGLKVSGSWTPTLISDTLPPSPIAAWKVPAGKALLLTGGMVHALVAATEYVRVCRRHFLFGWQATAAPAAPAAPTVALAAMTAGIGTAGAFTYKLAPVDTFNRESAATVASASVTLTATNQGVTVTPPALPVGAVGYNVYRTLAGGAVWYFVGQTIGAAAYIDATPDSAVNTAYVPSATWATGAVAGETMDGPGEVIVECGAVALTGAPTSLIYTGAVGLQSQAIAVAFPATIGARLRVKLMAEASNLVPVPTVAANVWRGPWTADPRGRHEHDLGATAVRGVNAGPSAGSFMVWGQQVIAATSRVEATAAIKALPLVPTNPHGVLVPENGEIVVEWGALALGVAGVRDVSLTGSLLPIATA